MKPQHIYIFNIPEDVWPFITSISNKKEYSNEISWCANVAERDLITISDKIDPIFISPKKISDGYIKYIGDIFNIKNITVLTPNKNTGEICKDILNDDLIFTKISSFKKIEIVSYSSSYQFISLVERLRETGCEVLTPESPEKNCLKSVNYFGSKSGIRNTIPKLMAKGSINNSISEATEYVLSTKNKLGVVIKTDKGHGGEGIKILKNSEISNLTLSNLFNSDNYWRKFPIIVEELLNVKETPNVEFLIDPDGVVNFLYYCSMRVDKNGFYKGQEMHNSVLPNDISKKLTNIGFKLGKIFSNSGYRGYFDVDFIIDSNDKILVTESNTRHTGGTHVYRAAINLFGNNFMDKTHVLSNNDYLLPKDRKYNFLGLIKKLKPILFNKNTKEGLIIVSDNSIKFGMIAYIIFANNKEKALDIESKMGVLLENGHNPRS